LELSTPWVTTDEAIPLTCVNTPGSRHVPNSLSIPSPLSSRRARGCYLWVGSSDAGLCRSPALPRCRRCRSQTRFPALGRRHRMARQRCGVAARPPGDPAPCRLSVCWGRDAEASGCVTQTSCMVQPKECAQTADPASQDIEVSGGLRYAVFCVVHVFRLVALRGVFFTGASNGGVRGAKCRHHRGVYLAIRSSPAAGDGRELSPKGPGVLRDTELDRRGPGGLELSNPWVTTCEATPLTCVNPSGSRQVQNYLSMPSPLSSRGARGCYLWVGSSDAGRCRSPALTRDRRRRYSPPLVAGTP
jgi:hypothetical protein